MKGRDGEGLDKGVGRLWTGLACGGVGFGVSWRVWRKGVIAWRICEGEASGIWHGNGGNGYLELCLWELMSRRC